MIKGGFFLKSLKQLFIISLISCFILLANSFVSASCYKSYSDGEGDYLHCDSMDLNYVYNNNGYLIGGFKDSHYNFTDFKFLFNIPDVGNLFMYRWQNDGLNYSYRSKNLNNGHYGRVNGFFYSDSGAGGNRSDIYLKDDQTFTYIEGFENLPDYLDDTFIYAYFYCGDLSLNCKICLSDKSTASDTNGRAVCVDRSYVSSNGGYIGLTGVNNLAVKNPYFKGGTSFNPSTGSRLGGRLITSSGYTNNQMIDAYQCVGLTPELCYGGFPLNDIFEPSETFEDFTGYVAGQGATIFDLYSLYPSYSSINQFLSTYLLRFQHGWTFKNEPKALYMLFAQINESGFKTSYISTYCDLLLNKNNNSSYTGNSVDDLRAQSCYRSQLINDSLKTSDGSDIVGQGSVVGIFGSGDDVDFDPETFFSNIMEKISSGLDNVSTGTAVGVIPGYIILFTLALIFIRMISH